MKHKVTLYISASTLDFWDTPEYEGQKYSFNVRSSDHVLDGEVLVGTKEFGFETADDLDITAGLIDGLEAKKEVAREAIRNLDRQIETLQCLEAPVS